MRRTTQQQIIAIGPRGGRIVGWRRGKPVYYREPKVPAYVPDRTPANLEQLRAVAKVFRDAGGQALLVGGAVRDMVFGKDPKDLDFEVFGLPPNEVFAAAQKLGKVHDVGASFGVLHVVTPDGTELDISLPRRESKIAPGHRGFDVATDPFMSIEEAARRRDFTFNALAYDPLRNKILDPFGGIQDAKRHILRVTDPVKFGEDPLRVLRGVQFVARFDLAVDEKTFRVMQRLLPQLDEIAPERIAGEFTKLLLKGIKPSRGLELARQLGFFKRYYPEIERLNVTPQNPKYHPEGNVWKHTLLVCDHAARTKESVATNQQLPVMLAAFLHDIGKPATTKGEGENITSYGHDEVGAQMVPDLLRRLGYRATDIIEETTRLVALHLRPWLLWFSEEIKGETVKPGTFVRLARDLQPANIYQLAAVVDADSWGHTTDEGQRSRYGAWLIAKATEADVGEKPPPPLLSGKFLIGLGYQPGPQFGQVIRAAEKARERGLTEAEAKEIVRRAPDLLSAQLALAEWGRE